MNKSRHSITISDPLWSVLKELKNVQNTSISSIIEKSVKNYIKDKKYNSVYFKIMGSVSECDDDENLELSNILDSLTDEDMEIVESYKL